MLGRRWWVVGVGKFEPGKVGLFIDHESYRSKSRQISGLLYLLIHHRLTDLRCDSLLSKRVENSLALSRCVKSSAIFSHHSASRSYSTHSKSEMKLTCVPLKES